MRKLILAIFVLLSIAVNAKDYIITDYGASNDSTKLNTEAIQKVIDLASAEGGGTIIIPEGVFLSGALFFRPNTNLKVEEGAVLKGSDVIDNYPFIPSRMEGQSIYYYAALINAYNVDNFSIEGPGKIDGNGLNYWKAFWQRRKENAACTNLEVSRPRLIFVWGCDHVKIQNVKLHNSGFWTTHLYQCNDVVIDGCDIRSPYKPIKAPSTDGVDIDFCRNVIVRNCYIAVNDDGVCIKGGKGFNAHELYENGITENVLIENCEFGFVHASLTLGSECIHAKNIVMRNCKVNNNRPLLHMKMRPDTYQVFEDITIENITGKCGSVLQIKPWTQFFNMEGSAAKPYAIVRNINFSDIDVSCETLGMFKGNPTDSISNITLKNIRAQVKNTEIDVPYETVKFENVKVNGKEFVLKQKKK